MALNAGRLRHRILIQARTVGESESGTPLEQYATVEHGDRRAEVAPVSGREFFASQERHGEITHKITMRYFEPVTTAMRVVYRGGWFDIISPPMHSLDRAETVLMCKLLEGKPL